MSFCIRRISPGALATALLVSSTLPVVARVTVRPPAIDFGSRGHNQSPEASIDLVNEFPTPVRILRMKPSCSCIKVRPAALTASIAPGAAATVRVTMSSGRAFGRLSKYIEVDVGSDTRQIGRLRVPVSMRVFEDYQLEPRELRFEGEYGAAPVTVSALVRSKRKQPGRPLDLRLVRITDRSGRMPTIEEYFTVEVSEHAQGATIAATLSPRHPEGRVWGDLEATLDGKPFVLPIAGDMFRGVLLSPKYFNFSRVDPAVPESQLKYVVLRAIDGRPFKILGMTPRITAPKKPGFGIELALDAGQDDREHVVRARVVAPGGFPVGSFSGKVEVRTSHPEKPRLELGFFGFFPKPKN